MSIIYFILVLSVIIIVHELGHLLTAKFFNVYCSEFAIGMGPKLYSKKFKETLFTIRAFPFGGFVSMAGEEGVDTTTIPKARTIKGIAPWKRMLVMLAGIILNLILGFVIFSGLFMYSGQYVKAPAAVIADVVADSPAQQAGFMANDKIVKVKFSDGTVIKPRDFLQLLQYTAMYSTETIYTVDRNGTLLDIRVTPVFQKDENRYFVGMMLPKSTIVSLNPIEAIGQGARYTVTVIQDIGSALGRLFKGIGFNQMSGPIGILQVTDDVVAKASTFEEGAMNLFNLIAVFSVNVGLFNLLPLPLFDGGRVLITFIEMIIRKPINEKLEYTLITGSAILVFALFIAITWQDIVRLITG